MKCKLKELIEIIEDYFNKEVWHTKPPIKEKDLQLAFIVAKLGAIKRSMSLGIVEDVNAKLAQLKSEIQQQFKIPLDKSKLNIWLKKDEKRHKVVLEIYKRL